MSTEDKNIIPFPGGDKERDNGKKKQTRIQRAAQWIRKHLGLSLLVGVAVPILAAVLGPSLSKNFGETRLTESYSMPYSYATDNYVANVKESDIKARMYSPREEDMDAEFYDKACAVRSFFSTSMVSKAQVTDSVLNIHELEKYEYADLSYFAFAKDTENGTEVRVYIVNSGNGASDSDTLTFSGQLVSGEDFGGAEDFAWDKMDSGALERSDGNGYAVDTEAVCGGAGDGDDKYTYYVYVNVPEDAGRQIPVNAAFSIQDRASVDTVIIPSESCAIRYSMTYRVDGKDMETDEFSTIIRVPLYKFFASHSIASHMNEEDIAHYVYQSDPELHEKTAFDPLSLAAENE